MDDLIRKYAARNAKKHGNAQKDAVIGKVFADNPELKENAGEVVQRAGAIIDEVNALSDDELDELLDQYEYEDDKEDDQGLPDLPDVDEENGVVMRMAPFPSGMLHIGNARMAVLNDEYVKRYGGKLYLVIDDTAGSEEKKPILDAYEQIPNDLEWLGVDFDEILYKSDRMEQFYEYAEQFLEEGWAYVCTCDADTLRENRRSGEACGHRDQDPDTNLAKWEDMLAGEYSQGEAVVRLKTDMQHKDPAFRDRVLLRVSELDHPKVGTEYPVWPMLEFSWAIDDHELGMTHIIRGSDLVMEDKMEQYMWDLLGWDHPEIVHHGLLHIEGIKISTSQSRHKIADGEYTGWKDPRTWSLMSLRKRGIQPEAIRSFVKSFGMSNNTVRVPVDTLYTENRRVIDPEADRYFFIEDPTKMAVTGVDEAKTAKLDRHPEHPDRGQREITVTPDDGVASIMIEEKDFEPGTELRLKDLYNIRIEDDGSVEKIGGGLDYARDNKLGIIQWLPVDAHKECSIIMPDGTRKNGFCEENLDTADHVIQFIRFGFCRVDAVEGEDVLCYFTHQ